MGRGGTRGGAGAAAATGPAQPSTNAYQYKIEVSTDGSAYTTALDMTKNDGVRNTIFEQFPPVKCRYVRLTMTNWPRGSNLGIIEFTAFGKAADSLPAARATPAR